MRAAKPSLQLGVFSLVSSREVVQKRGAKKTELPHRGLGPGSLSETAGQHQVETERGERLSLHQYGWVGCAAGQVVRAMVEELPSRGVQIWLEA